MRKSYKAHRCCGGNPYCLLGSERFACGNGRSTPESISKNATIVETDGTVLQSGSNGWTCSPTSGPGSTHPMCNDAVWMRLMTALNNKADFKTDRICISYMLAGDDDVNNADPFDTKPDPGEVWVQEGQCGKAHPTLTSWFPSGSTPNREVNLFFC
jgi:hypothetical protein